MSLKYCLLPQRRTLAIGGEDRISFLQGLVSNDVQRTQSGEAVHAAFLTPQGKYICDFFIIDDADRLLLDVEESAADSLKKKLTLHKLRAKVSVEDVSDEFQAIAIWGEGKLDGLEGGILYDDPRLEAAGQRALMRTQGRNTSLEALEVVDFKDYDGLRISLGLPDGSRDMEVDRSILLEYGFDELNGVDWKKGCYMGQELTARTKYRALIKKRLFPLEIEGGPLEPGTEIMAGDKKAGEIRSVAGNHALGFIKLEFIDDALSANGAKVTPRKPDWMNLPQAS